MPRPESLQANTAAESSAEGTTAMGRPQLVVDGNKNPLLQISGKLQTFGNIPCNTQQPQLQSFGQNKQVMKQRSKSANKVMC
jgi:hypothetical protein